MPSVDLTGTTWVFNTEIPYNGYLRYNINFRSNETNYIAIQYDEDGFMYRFTESITYTVYNEFLSGPWIDEAYKTITITGGTDATNTNLINWLEANATQQTTSTKVSVDLTTLTGWAALSAGEHTITIKAKAAGYRDSEPSAEVQVTKASQGYKLTLTTIYLNAGNTVSVHMNNADGTSTTANTLSNGMSWENVKSFYITDTYDGAQIVTINGADAAMPTEATPYTLTQDTAFTYDNACLTGDMLVTLADGSEKQICELTSDDTYLAYDFATGDLATAKAEYIDAVNGHSGKFADKYQKYTFEDGTVIKEVHKHRFLNLRKMEFINLCDWEIGDRIYKIDGTTPALISKEVITEEVEHFTVTTVNYHSGFVQSCLYGDRYTQKYEIHMVDGKPVYDFSKPHTMDYLYGKVPQND